MIEVITCRALLALPNVPLHLIQRGNNRQACFFADGGLPLFYLDWLSEHAGKTGCRAHAYVLMTNHVANPPLAHQDHGLAFTHSEQGCREMVIHAG